MTPLTLWLGSSSEASSSSVSASSRGLPPPNSAGGSDWPWTCLKFQVFVFVIVYSVGLNRTGIVSPFSIASSAFLKPLG